MSSGNVQPLRLVAVPYNPAELLAGYFGGAVYAERLGPVSLLVGMIPLPLLAPEDVVRRVEHHAASDLGRCSGYVERSYCVHRERRRRIDLAIVHPVKRGRIEHPVRFQRGNGRCDARFIRHVEVLVSKTHGIFVEDAHEVLPELAR
jgi:hypothetical protein